VSLAYFLLFWRVYRDPKDDPELSDAERRYIAETAEGEGREPDPPAASLGYLLRQKKVLGLALGFGSYNYVFYLLLTWLPTYLSAELHISLLNSFLYTSVPWLFATATDLTGGWLADALIRRGWDASRARKLVLVCGTMFGLGILGAANAHTATRALVWISVSIGGLAAAAPVGWSIPSLIAPRGSVGSVGGILNFSNQLSGIAAPVITGYVLRATHSYVWVFVIPAIYLAIGIASYIFLLGRIEQVPQEFSS
jgi:MFS family permease